MMWAYRLEPAKNQYGMARPIAQMREAIGRIWNETQTHNIDLTETLVDTPHQFEQDLKTAKAMARALGWDTSTQDISCYLVPGPQSYLYGFILTQATGSQRYLISPVPLDYMNEHIDWNARTSTEEVVKMRQALDGSEPERPPIKQTEWKLSKKGNNYCHINGALVTIFKNDGGGFKAIIGNDVAKLKTFTNAFETEQAVAQYVTKNFYDLIKHWGLDGNSSNEANPFHDVDWGDDADPVEDLIPF